MGSGGAGLERSADEVTSELLEWLATVAPGIPASAPTLTSPLRKAGIDLRLVRATPRPSPRIGAASLAIDLDYLVTVQLADSTAEHHATSELMFAAMGRQDLEVLGGDEVARVSTALGLPIAPGFILRMTLVRERQHRPERLTRIRAPIAAKPARSFIDGRVVGLTDNPIDGATVEAVGHGAPVRTDSAGRFRIEAAGPEGAAVRLVARADGAQVEAVAVAGLPVTLRLRPTGSAPPLGGGS
jgi:hypothetical protein